MAPNPHKPRDEDTCERPPRLGPIRPLSVLILALFTLTQIPVASAGHGAAATTGLTRGHGILLLLGGVALLGGTLALKRMGHISPRRTIYGVFGGIVLAALGATLFSATSPEPTYAAGSMPFSRSLYQPLAITVGLLITVGSYIVGWLRWPSRPRYTFLGMLMGLWILYPSLIPGYASDSHPLGYAIVLATPILIGYVIWKDAWDALRVVLQDPIARRFGIGVGIVMALFFMSVTSYLSFFPEPGVPSERTIGIFYDTYQLVTWPLLIVRLPNVPLFHEFFLAVSPGQFIVTGLLSTLVGLHAAMIARYWRVEEQAGMTESTAGTGAIIGASTCGCCGPLVAKVAILAAGPSIAAPLYWIFVDPASPLSTLFIITSVLLFTAIIIYSVETARLPDHSASVVPAD